MVLDENISDRSKAEENNQDPIPVSISPNQICLVPRNSVDILCSNLRLMQIVENAARRRS
ncbi:Hypothetical predicted protein [Prunus dulcis]|uniref:Uncharacterized protein n=1 Tax=Prunus dulcis TaxID=3755 RepID=A0A5E4GGI0_PRUDU|nr:Hypothetical predicted protein [Prunus dulcis]VVA40787.1 Hypothetical predicted protein [Prunus dulcis]